MPTQEQMRLGEFNWSRTLQNRNLTIDDMHAMHIDEREKFIQRANIWKKPDYQSIIDAGKMPREAAYLMKQVYDAIPAKPASQSSAEQYNYIKFVSAVRDAMEQTKTPEDINKAMKTVLIDNGFITTDKRVAPGFERCVSRKLAVALQQGYDKVEKDANDKMFCYHDEEKQLAFCDIWRYTPETCKLLTVDNQPHLAVTDAGKTYLFTMNAQNQHLMNPETWSTNTSFLTRNNQLVARNIPSLEQARAKVLELAKPVFHSRRILNYTRSIKPEPLSAEKMRDLGLQPPEPVFKPAEAHEETKAPVIPAPEKKPVERILEPITTSQHPVAAPVEEVRAVIRNDNTPDTAAFAPFSFYGGVVCDGLDAEKVQNIANAFTELQGALQIEAQDISLGGNLAVSLQDNARGVLASYDYDNDTLRISKLDSPDQLAHAWFHALDAALGDYNQMYTPMSQMPFNEIKQTSPAFARLIQATMLRIEDNQITETNYATESKKMDLRTSSTANYWHSTSEMLARAFSCYIADKLDRPSPYLTGLNETVPVPHGEERKAINQAFDAVITDIKKRGILHDVPVPEQKKTFSLDDLIAAAGGHTSGNKGSVSKNREDR